MSFKWPLKKISDVAIFLNNKRVPISGLEREKRKGIYPYYGASGIVDYIDGYIFHGTYLLISEDGENLRTRNTPIAFKATGKFWVNNHAHILDEKEDGILDYLEYYFSIFNLTPYLTGAVQPKLNKANLDSIEIPIPPTNERLRINKILNSLTYRVKCNARINQTLESIVQTIFKSWFVDFEPTRAKITAKEEWATQNLQTPENDPSKVTFIERAAIRAISGKTEAELDQLDEDKIAQLKATAALFPDSLVDSELGDIPDGWLPQKIENILELAYGKALNKTERTEGNVPVYGSGGLTGKHNLAIVDGPGIIVGRKGTVGSLYWEDKPFYPIDTVFYVKCLNNTTLVYAYYLLQTLGLEDMNTDAAVPGLNRNNVYRLEVPGIPKELIQVFSTTAVSIRSLIRAKNEEIALLEKIRDDLLPKLLSGEVSLSEAS